MNIKTHTAWSIIVMVAIGSAILVAGPWLSIQGNHPLQSWQYRILAAMGLPLLFFARAITQTKQTTNPERKTGDYHWRKFKQHYHQLLLTCWRTKYGFWPFFTKTPCTLILGYPLSGKSQLINGLSPHARVVDKLAPTTSSRKLPIWWRDENRAWLELSADTSKYHAHIIVKKLWSYMRWYRFMMPLHSIFITIDLRQLYQHNNDHQLKMIAKINQLLTHIQQQHRCIPTYIIFTKSDLIHGFSDFYAAPSSDTNIDILGIDLSDQDHAPVNVGARLNQLITQLHEEMIKKVHAERSLQKKQCIQDFVRQMDALKPTMVSICKNLFQHTGMLFQGIYFNSNEQNEQAIDYLGKTMAQAFNIHSDEYPAPFPEKRSFFSRGIKQALRHNQHQRGMQRYGTKTKLFAGSVLLSMFGIAYVQYSSLSAPAYSANNIFSQAAHGATMLLPNNSRVALSQAIKQRIENTLQQAIDRQSIQTYSHLITYLSLGKQLKNSNISLQTLGHLFQGKTQPPLTSAQIKQLQTWLSHWKHHNHTITTDPNLIEASLKVLQQQPMVDMVYAQLLASLETPPKSADQPSTHQPYTHHDFEKIIQSAMPTAAQTFMQFQKQYPLTTTITYQDLMPTLRGHYIHAYQTHWEQYILQTMLREPKNKADAINMLTAIEDSRNGLIHHLQQTIHETIYSPDPLFQTHIASHFRPYQSYLTNQAGSTSIRLSQLKDQLIAIERSPLPQQAAFQFSRNTALQDGRNNVLGSILQHADTAPQPIANWLKNTTRTVWKQLLTDSKHYINTQWRSTIYQPYIQKIHGKFPFDPNATVDVEPDDFESFFATHGIINSFFTQYIEPFAKQHNRYWTWKNIFEDTLGISQNHLELFTRSQLISEMFFQGQEHLVDTSFSLRPTQIPSNINRVSVQTGNTQATYLKNQTPNKVFHWPSMPYTSNMNIENQFHGLSGITHTGFWGLFHLLNEAQWRTNPHNNQITLSYHFGGDPITMALQPSTHIHPFIPNILSELHADKDL